MLGERIGEGGKFRKAGDGKIQQEAKSQKKDMKGIGGGHGKSYLTDARPLKDGGLLQASAEICGGVTAQNQCDHERIKRLYGNAGGGAFISGG